MTTKKTTYEIQSSIAGKRWFVCRSCDSPEEAEKFLPIHENFVPSDLYRIVEKTTTTRQKILAPKKINDKLKT
jgi:hypothetical protein